MKTRHTNSNLSNPYMQELVSARCVRSLAGILSIMRMPTFDPNLLDQEAFDRLLEDTAAVREEYCADPGDMQLALETHEPKLAVGA